MRLAVKAWRLRLAAREALDAGDCRGALELASEAEQLQRTPRGNALRILTAWLTAESARSH
jgi:hypothetical protein